MFVNISCWPRRVPERRLFIFSQFLREALDRNVASILQYRYQKNERGEEGNPISDQTPKMTVQTLNRLPYYYSYLKQLGKKGVPVTTASAMAEALGLNEVVVRKDLSAIRPAKGRPNTGFPVDEMTGRIADSLGYNNTTEAVLAGAGPRGKALLTGLELEKLGMHIVACFDPDPALTGTTCNGVEVFPLGKLRDLAGRLHVQVGILAVPEQAAQGACNLMVESGIRYILNYAPVFLSAPPEVYIQNENPTVPLTVFLQHIRSEENKNRA